jgi:hypothetical protein
MAVLPSRLQRFGGLPETAVGHALLLPLLSIESVTRVRQSIFRPGNLSVALSAS